MKNFIAKLLYLIGFKPCISSDVFGLMTYGYGELGFYGYWKYPIDRKEIKSIDTIKALIGAILIFGFGFLIIGLTILGLLNLLMSWNIIWIIR